MNESTFADGRLVEQIIDNGDGTGTRTTFHPDGAVDTVEQLTGLPIPPPPEPDPMADLQAQLAAQQALIDELLAALGGGNGGPTMTDLLAAAQALRARIDKVAPPVVNDGDIDPSTQVDDPLAAEVAELRAFVEALKADPEAAKVIDFAAIATAAEGSKGDDALVLAVAKALGADPAEVRKKRDENPQWFADVVAKYGLGGDDVKSDDTGAVKG